MPGAGGGPKQTGEELQFQHEKKRIPSVRNGWVPAR